ncbi:MAG: CPCC family cysteine-rich protein [Chloroflexia bacterium]
MEDEAAVQAKQRWFEVYAAHIDAGIAQPSQPNKLYICPCCGYPTLSERGSYLIGELCDWEDDGQDDPHVDERWGGPNGSYSLAEARANFKQHLTIYSPLEEARRTKRYKTNLARTEAKRRLMEAFESLAMHDSETWSIELWEQIFQLENALLKAHDQLPLP